MESPLGAVPAGWKTARLADLATRIGSGATPLGGSAVYLDQREEFALIRSQNVLDRAFDSEGLAYISTEAASKLSLSMVSARDVLLNITGDGVTFSRSCIVPNAILPACVNQHVATIRANAEMLDPGFLLAYLTHPDVKAYIASFNAGASRRAVTKRAIESFVLPVPPVLVQRKIGGVLEVYDDLVENNLKRIGVLEEMIDCVWVRYANGSSVATMTLGEIADRSGGTIRTGPFGSQLHESDYAEDGTPVVMPKNIIAGRLREYGIARIPEDVTRRVSQHRMMEGDVVYGRRGDIGRRAYIGPRQVGWICGTGCLRISIPAAIVHPRYVYAWLGRPSVVAAIAAKAVGATMPNLNTSILREVSIEVPSLDVQENFVKFASVCDQEIDCLEMKIDTLRATRDLLLPRLISGELDVSHVPDPAAL